VCSSGFGGIGHFGHVQKADIRSVDAQPNRASVNLFENAFQIKTLKYKTRELSMSTARGVPL